MNGRPPAYSSREMIALTAYIAYLSKGQPVAALHGAGLETIVPQRPPDAVNGGGTAAGFPPLRGSASFNSGAGMHRLATMAGFIRCNMPYGAPPDRLTHQQAGGVVFPALPASAF